MTEIVMQQLQLDRVPQPQPRTAEYAIYELVPQLREGRFYPLSYSAYQSCILLRICPRYDKHIAFLRQKLSQFFSSVAQIGQHYSPVYQQQKSQRWVSIIAICWCQNRPADATVNVPEQMQLEAKEPPSASLAEISSIFSQVSCSAMSNWFAYSYRFGIYQIQSHGGVLASGTKQMAYDVGQQVQAANPFLVGDDIRESVFVIADDELIGLLESGNTEAALHQGDSNNFGVGESREAIVGRSPIGQMGIGFEEIINEAIDFSHLVYTRSHRGHPPGERFRSTTQSYTPLGFG